MPMKRIGGGGIVGSGTSVPAYEAPPSIEDPATAIDMRDTVETISQDVYDSNQIFRRATVVSIAADRKSVTVQFIDEPGNPFTVAVTNMVPTAVGQQVEIEVRNGNEFYINSILGATEVVEPPVPAPTEIPTVTVQPGIRQLVISWTRVVGADYYRVERSQDSTFATGIILHAVTSNLLVLNNLVEDTVWFVRVAAVNDGGIGPVSQGVQGVVGSEAPISDGLVPADSPAVTVSEGLGFLFAQWAPQPNADLVTYEVYISTVSNFIPDATTKVAETESTFYFANTLPDKVTKLAYGTRYYIRIRARDADGVAPAFSAQGSGIPQKVELGDAGSIPTTSLVPDGNPPSVPGTPAVSSGLGYLYVKWAASSSVDEVAYEVHVSTVSGFIPDANTLSLVTKSLFGFVRKQGPGASSADLVYGTTYYLKIVARDADGVSAPSAQASGFTVRANTADIAVNAITAASGIIADLAIGEAKIAGAAITRAKIRDAAIGTLQVEDGQITNAKIASLQASKITTDLLSATLTISGRIITSSGTARVEMNSSGFFAYNSAGNPTVSINNSGSASFSGTISGSTITGTNIDGSTVTGGTMRTAATGTRIVMDTSHEMKLFSGTATYPAVINQAPSGTGTVLRFYVGEHGSGANTASYLFYNAEFAINLVGGGYFLVNNTYLYVNRRIQTTGQIDVAGNINNNGWNISSNGYLYDRGNRVYSGTNPPPAAPVSSVNGRTGAVSGLSESHSHPYSADTHGHSYGNFSVSGYLQAAAGSGVYCGSHLMINDAGSPTVFNAGGSTRIGVGNVTDHLVYMQNKAATAYSRVWGGVYTNQSSRDVKEDIQPSESSLAIAKKIRVVTYHRKDYPQGIRERGVIAEELKEIDPILITEMPPLNPDDPVGHTLGVDVTALAVTALHAVQELAAEVAELRGQMNPPAPQPA